MANQRPIYLDHNATTPLSREALDAMLPYLREHFGNPSSSHVYGQHAAAGVVEAREHVAALLGCDADEIIFTSGGTEANNLAIRGSVATCAAHQVVTSVIEHPAVERPCAWLEQAGYDVVRLPVDTDGRVDLDAAAAALRDDTALLTVMHSNNETGVLQPVAALAELARQVGATIHTDAAQSVGKVPVDVDELGIDLLSLAGHKLYAPKGVGALYVRRGTPLEPVLLGAAHEGGLRPGTENVASIVGLGAACATARRDLDEAAERMSALRDELWDRLAAEIPGLALNGHAEHRLPNTLNARFPDVGGDAILEGAPEVAASTGSACDAGHTSASAVILAMDVDPEEAIGSIRLTLGRDTTATDVARAAYALTRAWRKARAR